jgi:L-ascorbate oxidase
VTAPAATVSPPRKAAALKLNEHKNGRTSMNLALRSTHKGLPLAISALALLCTQTVNAQIKELVKELGGIVNAQIKELGELSNPPVLKMELKREVPATREVSLDLEVVYIKGKIWNPAALPQPRFDQVNLRGYWDRNAPSKLNAPVVSPTLEILPGDTIRINLHNMLPPDPSCTDEPHRDMNVPHCFNGTNLHTHGLWVNPVGNSDNVLISINPSVNFQYEYNVPPDHPAGTFWYHTHRHGSTALQVSSGMAGALIIRGNRLPTLDKNGDIKMPGDIDTLLKPTKTQPFKERVLVLQQIAYACRDRDGNIKVKKDNDGVIAWVCDPDDVGTVEKYEDQFNPPNWRESGRNTSINGHVLPTFNGVSAGQIERWRVIHGGVRDTISLQFRKRKSGGPSLPALGTAAEHDAFVLKECTGAPLSQHLIAADGLTTSAAIERKEMVVYQPAYRWDTLMVFPEPGEYCMINVINNAKAAPSRRLLGFVKVDPGRPVPANDIRGYLMTELVDTAEVNMPPDVRDTVVADLSSGLKFSSFVPHPDVKDNEVKGNQNLEFNIVEIENTNPKRFEFQVDGKSFDPNRVDRVLKLGSVDEWTLKSDLADHPFHIHINPFQVVKILDPSGKDVSTPDANDNAGGTTDPQYSGLKGVWKDTLWVKGPIKDVGQYEIFVRTRYNRYIGYFVLHCHILDHEDQGMMQLIRVQLPEGEVGGTSQGFQRPAGG